MMMMMVTMMQLTHDRSATERLAAKTILSAVGCLDVV
jgi:hypothetical protein